MHEFTPEILERLEKKLDMTRKNAIRYKNMALKYNSYKFWIKSERLNSCLNFWMWDKYSENKLLDLQRVNRCMDRFCPNCRSMAISKALVNFSPKNKEMLDRGYIPFMMTLTVPNVAGEQLEKTINRMNKAFQKLNRWYYKDTDREGGYKNRFFRIAAMIKSLELTVQKSNWNMYHPHFHCIAFLEAPDLSKFEKHLPGPFSKKSKSYIKYSDADIQVQKLWKFAYENIRITEYEKYPDSFEYEEANRRYIYYQCDIRELEIPKGVYEVFKYAFKDSDIHTQENFETLWTSLSRKRLRQGHGELYNLELDCDSETDSEMESIETYLKKEEAPERVVTKELEELTTTYSEYRKISRFKSARYMDEID